MVLAVTQANVVGNLRNVAVDRPCTYNDEWTFQADGDIRIIRMVIFGESLFDFQGSCYSESDLVGPLAGWQSGTHGFEIILLTTPSRSTRLLALVHL